MSTNGIDRVFNAGFKVKLQNRGPKSSGITFELKSVFDEMAKQGLIKDTDGKGLTKQDALNLYAKLNEMHQETNRATNYTRMQVGQEFDYTAEEMKALAQAAGYEIIEQAPAEADSEPQEETPAIEPSIDEAPIAGPPEGEDPEYDQAVTVGVEPEEEKAEEPLKPIVTGPANDPEYEQGRLSLVEEDFNANGQVGKISQGKYYINGTEVSKEVYEVAKTRAVSSENKPVDSQQTEVKNYVIERLGNTIIAQGGTGKMTVKEYFDSNNNKHSEISLDTLSLVSNPSRDLIQTMKLGVNSSPDSRSVSSEIRNKKGKVIMSYKDGKFYNARGKEIKPDKVNDYAFEVYYHKNRNNLVLINNYGE